MISIGQIIGIVAMIVNILSFQCRKNKNLFLTLGVGCTLFSISFLMLGAYASGIYNLIHILRSSFTQNEKLYNKKTFVFFCILYIVASIPTFVNIWSIVLLSAQIVQTYVMWFKDGGLVRKAQIFYISPVWLVNNIIVSSIGGIICEAFVISSAVISYFRFRKKGFEK